MPLVQVAFCFFQQKLTVRWRGSNSAEGFLGKNSGPTLALYLREEQWENVSEGNGRNQVLGNLLFHFRKLKMYTENYWASLDGFNQEEKMICAQTNEGGLETAGGL